MGDILIGRAITERPDLFVAANIAVGEVKPERLLAGQDVAGHGLVGLRRTIARAVAYIRWWGTFFEEPDVNIVVDGETFPVHIGLRPSPSGGWWPYVE